jgi:hypothetical protein
MRMASGACGNGVMGEEVGAMGIGVDAICGEAT